MPNYMRNPVMTGFWALMLLGGVAAYVLDSRAKSSDNSVAQAQAGANAAAGQGAPPIVGTAQPVKPGNPDHSETESSPMSGGADPLKPAEIKPDIDPMASGNSESSEERGTSEPITPENAGP